MSRLTDKNYKTKYIVYNVIGLVDKLGQYEDIEENPEHLAKIKKALEIIKNKRVDTRAFIEILEDEWTWEQYMDEEDDINTRGHQFSRDRLTQEEYDLLKEVLL